MKSATVTLLHISAIAAGAALCRAVGVSPSERSTPSSAWWWLTHPSEYWSRPGQCPLVSWATHRGASQTARLCRLYRPQPVADGSSVRTYLTLSAARRFDQISPTATTVLRRFSPFVADRCGSGQTYASRSGTGSRDSEIRLVRLLWCRAACLGRLYRVVGHFYWSA